jgi:hypothetical protein
VDKGFSVRSINRVPYVIAAALLAFILGGTARPISAQVCDGDCNSDRHVMVDELVSGVSIALGKTAVSACATSIATTTTPSPSTS